MVRERRAISDLSPYCSFTITSLFNYLLIKAPLRQPIDLGLEEKLMFWKG